MKLHQNLSLETWQSFSLETQLSNIGSEVIRSLKWHKKGHAEYANLACHRALELFDLTLSCPHRPSALREVARARELWLDFFLGENQYNQTAQNWERYFLAFNFAAQNKT